MEPQAKRLIVGITGSTGIIFGIRLLELLRPTDIETHLVVTKAAEITRAIESTYTKEALASLATVTHSIHDIAAPIASGSFRTLGMIIAPCSIHSMSQIASGATGNLLTRAADVVLKERRRLVLMVRETPLHAGHLKSMLAITDAGGIIAPPVPAFYSRPASIDDLVTHSVGRVLDLFDIDLGCVRRWGENAPQDGPSD